MNPDRGVEDQESFFIWIKVFVIIVMLTLAIPLFLFVDERQGWLVVICSATAIYALAHKVKFGSLNLGVNALLVIGVLALNTSLYIQRDTTDLTELIWLASFPIGAGMMTNPKQTLFWSLISWVNLILALFLLPNGLDNLKYGIHISALIAYSGGLTFIFKARQKALMEMRDKERIQYRSLLRVICHDIASPISVIDGSLEVMRDAIESGDMKTADRYFNTSIRSITVIKDILRDVRHLESANSGKIKFTEVSVNLSTVFQNLEELYHYRLASKNIELNFKGNKDKFPHVLGDYSKIQNQVLANLISNAIKFSNNGGKIEISVLQTGAYVTVNLKDYGIGIPPDLLKKLFDPVQQTNRPGTNGEKGSGFGMPIVKSYIEAMGASINVTSEVGAETNFELIFRSAD